MFLPVFDEKLNLLRYKRDDLKEFMKPTPRDIHKGDRGGVLICGGSWCYRGAPVLAARGALRAGAGLVVLAIPDFMAEAASIALPEAIFVPLNTKNNVIQRDSVECCVAQWLGRCGCAVFGPGIGRSGELEAISEWFWNNWDKPMLWDADALYFFSALGSKLHVRDDVIITPHCGEAATILGTTAGEVNANRLASAQRLTAKAAVAVLKGMNTVVASREESRIINEGSPSLAVPGSGDVLSGVIGALLASGITAFDAATVGALLHAAAGSNVEAKIGLRGVLAREIADELPAVFR